MLLPEILIFINVLNVFIALRIIEYLSKHSIIKTTAFNIVCPSASGYKTTQSLISFAFAFI